jgi:hypothetical protein
MATATEALDVAVRGVVAKWVATTALNGIVFNREERRTGTQANPASGTHFPYCVLVDGTAAMQRRSAQSEYWEVKFSLHVYVGENPESLRANCDAVRTVFDSNVLALTLDSGWSLVERNSGPVREKMNAKTIWRSEMDYRLLLARSRPA